MNREERKKYMKEYREKNKEHCKEYQKYRSVAHIKQLEKENKKYKEVIDKSIELNKQVIKDTKEFYRPTKDIIYSGDTLIDIAEQNLKILKEVE